MRSSTRSRNRQPARIFTGWSNAVAAGCLMTRDRMPSGDFLLTQEFLGMMLGVRRTTVTDVMGTLAKSGADPLSARPRHDPRPRGFAATRLRMLRDLETGIRPVAGRYRGCAEDRQEAPIDQRSRIESGIRDILRYVRFPTLNFNSLEHSAPAPDSALQARPGIGTMTATGPTTPLRVPITGFPRIASRKRPFTPAVNRPDRPGRISQWQYHISNTGLPLDNKLLASLPRDHFDRLLPHL